MTYRGADRDQSWLAEIAQQSFTREGAMEAKSVANECKLPPSPLPRTEIWDAWDEEAARTRSQHGARLEDIVRERIIPRLVLLHKDLPQAVAIAVPTTADIVEFGRLIIGSDASLAGEFAERMRERGISSDDLFETLLAPTARHLGEMWEEDFCDFVEVGLGVGRLQALLGELSHAQMLVTDMRRRALLISTKSDQHVFGLDIVASFLRSSGWDTVIEKGLAADENARTVAGHWFAVAGVTMSRETSFDSVARVIVAVRRASMNPTIAIMVGGVAFTGRPDLVIRVGADAAANDGPGAALLAQRLHLRQSASPPPMRGKRNLSRRA
jgi:methanogenic corrinoid protein MtbC1